MSGKVEEFEGMFECPLGRNLFFHVTTDVERLWVLPKEVMKNNEDMAGKRVKLTGIWLDEVVISPKIIRPLAVELLNEEPNKVARNFRGKVSKSTVSGGSAWMLTTHDGIKYELAGGPLGVLEEGGFVEITGTVDTQRMGVTMAGSILKTDKITVLSGPESKPEAPQNKPKIDRNGIVEVNNDSVVY